MPWRKKFDEGFCAGEEKWSFFFVNICNGPEVT